MKISVIIPVGRRELYPGCRASVLRSIAACNAPGCEWQLVEVLDDGHRGVSWARNEGLRRATGDWIAWVDDDDLVAEDWAPCIGEGLESRPDVLSFDAQATWLDSPRPACGIGGCANAADVMSGRANSQLWNKVIRRELFDGRVFCGSIHEDYRILCEILPAAKTFKRIPETLYHYRRRRRGASQLKDADGVRSSLDGLICMCAAAAPVVRREIRKGVAQRLADFCVVSKGEWRYRRFILASLPGLSADIGLPARVKAKCALAALGFRKFAAKP